MILLSNFVLVKNVTYKVEKKIDLLLSSNSRHLY